MFTEHPDLWAPDLDTVLWRYMDMPKFVSLLEYQSLWFAGLDTLEDPYEGLPPRGLINEMWRSVEGQPESEQPKLRERVKHTSGVLASAREQVYANCWHASPVESAAMWKIYSRVGDGIAVRTTFERFRDCFSDSDTAVHGGMVDYVDLENFVPKSDKLSTFEWATKKRVSFAYEHEFRGLVCTKWVPDRGFLIPLDISRLIESVYISPSAPSWFADIVSRICNRYIEQANVVHSDLLSYPEDLEPIYSKPR